ncbi:MAG TPA: hypothetical protein PLI45_05065 [Candidatus Woesebacteria bacterium]|nr:hypothetical protein [Candidatus Woesebacteria bacterium]
MKVTVSRTKKETEKTKEHSLTPVSDIHPGYSIVQGIKDIRMKKGPVTKKITLIFDLPAFHDRTLYHVKVSIRLVNMTTNCHIPVTQNRKRIITLDPLSRYKLTVIYKTKSDTTRYQDTIVCNFLPEN